MAKTFETVLSVLDKFSKPILDLEEKLKKLGNTGSATQKQLVMSPSQKLWHEMSEGIAHAQEGFAGLGEHIGQMGEKLAEVLPMLGAVGGVAGVAGLVEMAHATAEASEALSNIAKITGTTVPQLQALDFAAKASGISQDQLATGMERLNANIGKTAEGQNKNLAALFRAMGVSIRDANGHVKSATELLPLIEASFAKTTDPALRSARAMALFGRAGEDLIPFLSKGPEAIAALQAQFDKFGYKFTGEDQEGLEAFNNAWKDSEIAVSGLRDAISAKLAPVMAPLLTQFATFVAANRDIIAANLKDVISKIGDSLSKINFKSMVDGIGGIFDKMNNLAGAIGGWSSVIEGLGIIMVGSFVAPLLQVGLSIAMVGARMAIFAGTQLMALGASFLEIAPAITSFKDVFAALDIAMDANPLGALVLVAAAAGAAAYELYENWNAVGRGLQAIWDGISTEFHKIWDPIEAAMQKFGNFLQSLQGTDFSWDAPESSPGAAPRVGSGTASSLSSAQGLFGSGAAAPPQVTVQVNNAPPGTTVTSTTKNGASAPIVQKTGSNGTLANWSNAAGAF